MNFLGTFSLGLACALPQSAPPTAQVTPAPGAPLCAEDHRESGYVSGQFKIDGNDPTDEVCSLQSIEEMYAWAMEYQDCRGDSARALWNADFEAAQSTEDTFYLSLYTSAGYERINGILRLGGRAAECLKPLTDPLEQVIAKEPPFLGDLWRGTGELFADADTNYPVGHIVDWAAFSSTSVSLKTAEDFTSSTGTIYKISSHGGCHDIRRPIDTREHEVTCLPHTHFKVLAHEPPNIVVLEEVDPQPVP